MNLGARMLLGYADDMRQAKLVRHACADCLDSGGGICARHRGACVTCSSEDVDEVDSTPHEDGVRGWLCAVCAYDRAPEMTDDELRAVLQRLAARYGSSDTNDHVFEQVMGRV